LEETGEKGNWIQLVALQGREAVLKEIERLEHLQRLADKVLCEAKATDRKLDDIECKIEEEAKRLDRLHPHPFPDQAVGRTSSTVDPRLPLIHGATL